MSQPRSAGEATSGAPSRWMTRYARRQTRAAWVFAAGLVARTGFAADPLDTSREGQLSAGSERVVALNEEGGTLYAAGDYRRAAERFLHAYAVDEDPNLLFNIASCYEALGDVDAALEKYRAFLAAPNADPEGRPRAELAIARLMAIEAAPPPEAPQPVAPPHPQPAAAAMAPADPGTHPVDWVPWVGVAGGTALATLGTAFYLLGAADHSKITGTPGFDEPDAVAGITRGRADDLVRSGDTKKAIGISSATAGAVLVAGSIVWWLVDPLSSPKATPALEVTLNPSETGLRFSGTF